MKKKIGQILILILVLFIFFITYKLNKKNNQPNIKEVNMAVIGNTIDNTNVDFTNFKHYLEKKLGIKVNILNINDVDTLIKSFNNKKIHLAYITTDNYYRLKDIVKPYLVSKKLINDGNNIKVKGYHKSEILIRKGFNINKKNKNIEAYDSESVDGFILPIMELKELGKDLRKNNKFKIVGSYSEMLKNLYNKEADMICIPEGLRFDLADKLNIDPNNFEVYYETKDEVPNKMIAFNRDVEASIIKMINNILINAQEDEEASEVFQKLDIKGFEYINDKILQNIKGYEKRLDK